MDNGLRRKTSAAERTVGLCPGEFSELVMSSATKRDAVCAWLLAAAAFFALASCGCDGYADVRMDIREGAMPEVLVVPVAELDQFDGRPIPAARVAFHDGRGVSAEEATLSESDGMVSTSVLIWDMPSRKTIDRLELGFTCTRDGYGPVDGVFKLKGFGGSSLDQTVLVFMAPAQTARQPAEATGGTPSH